MDQPGLLERGPQLEALDRRLAAAADGAGSLVLVAGEAGIGKSTLVSAFARRHATAVPVLRGRCDAMATAQPLGPLRDLARGGGPLAERLAAEAPRHELFAAVLDLLSPPAGPVLVVIEDVHWADEATLDLLIFLGRRIGDSRAVVVVTFRDDEDQPLRKLRGALATAPDVHRLTVPPLSRPAVAALAGAHQRDVDHLYAITGGNPFFVTEVLATPVSAVPPTVRDAVLARTAGLSPAARATLDALAVVPHRMDLALIRAVAATDDAFIDECQLAGVLRGDGRELWFRHELARLSIERALPTAGRSAAHATVLAVLTGRPDVDPSRLAYHAEHAGDAAAVHRHAPEAAARAARLGAHREAAAQYARALCFPDATTPERRAELLASFAEEARAVGRIADAIGASAQALSIWDGLGATERRCELQARHAAHLWAAGRGTEGYLLAEAAVSTLEELGAGAALASATATLASLRMLARDIPGAIATGRRAAGLARDHDRPATLALALNAVGTAQWFQEPDAAAGTLGEGLAVARSVGDDPVIAGCLVNLGSGAGEVRRYAEADRWLRETIAFCTARDMDAIGSYARAWLARVEFEQGRWPEAAALVAGIPAAPYVPTRIVALTVLGRLRSRRGEPEADGPLDEAWRLAEDTGDLQRLWPVAAGRAEAAWFGGRVADIPDLVTGTYEHAVRRGHPWAIGELGAWLRRAGRPVPLDGAAAPYREGAAAWTDLGCPYEAAEAAPASVPDLLAALAAFDRLGAWPAAEDVGRRLRDLGVRRVPRRPRRTTRANPGRLTDREIEVLRLVATGLRNAEIAARLHISTKTVDHHVSAVLAKLGAPSRREAVRVAGPLLTTAQHGDGPAGE